MSRKFHKFSTLSEKGLDNYPPCDIIRSEVERTATDMYKEEMAKFVKENNITDENLGLARFYYADMEKYEGKRFTERLNAALIKKLESLKTMEELEEAEKFEIIKSANNNYFITNRQDAEKIVDSEIKVKPKNSKDELGS